jgi:hypothetical protein
MLNCEQYCQYIYFSNLDGDNHVSVDNYFLYVLLNIFFNDLELRNIKQNLCYLHVHTPLLNEKEKEMNKQKRNTDRAGLVALCQG